MKPEFWLKQVQSKLEDTLKCSGECLENCKLCKKFHFKVIVDLQEVAKRVQRMLL